MFVLSSPSGAGKTTISRQLLETDPCLSLSVSVTTRPRRPGEVAGRDYHFVDTPRFNEMLQTGALLEHARVFNNYYGTPRAPVMQALDAGRDVLFDIDWQGTQQLTEMARDDLVKVFILPPSADELERRLYSRAQDPAEVIADRMARAGEEMSHYDEYDYIIVNRAIEESVAQARAILMAERLRRRRLVGVSGFVRALKDAL